LKKIEPAKKRSLPVVIWTTRIGESVCYPSRGEAEMSVAALLNLVKTYSVNSFSIQARIVTESIPKAS
jgi:hypothetical protein